VNSIGRKVEHINLKLYDNIAPYGSTTETLEIKQEVEFPVSQVGPGTPVFVGLRPFKLHDGLDDSVFFDKVGMTLTTRGGDGRLDEGREFIFGNSDLTPWKFIPEQCPMA
jgi:hypothetical protein